MLLLSADFFSKLTFSKILLVIQSVSNASVGRLFAKTTTVKMLIMSLQSHVAYLKYYENHNQITECKKKSSIVEQSFQGQFACFFSASHLPQRGTF